MYKVSRKVLYKKLVCICGPWEYFGNFRKGMYRQRKGEYRSRKYGKIVGMKEDEPETSEMAQKLSGATDTVNSHLQWTSKDGSHHVVALSLALSQMFFEHLVSLLEQDEPQF